MSKPALTIKEFLGPVKKGGISFSSSNKNSCFANIKVSNTVDFREIKTEPNKPLPNGLIRNWQISNSFNDNLLNGSAQLTQNIAKDFSWQALTVDSYGVLNMAKVQESTRKENTAFAKTTLNSDKNEVKKLSLGFSDAAVVYLNGTKIYSGNNRFRSRDYRYLGTLGLFDNLYLPLKKGENELLIGVSETFGGWGVKATLADLK